MLDKTIKFIAENSFVENSEDIYPIPTKLNIPEWFKKLNHSHEYKTIKGCMPFLDTLTTGYILKMPIDYYIKHNVEVDGEFKTGMASSAENVFGYNKINVNINRREEGHSVYQIKGSPLVEKNKNLTIHKILNPWTIVTPPGYSCLFTPILNNRDDRFEIISGIVDTDTFPTEINFPFIVNGDKYKSLDSLIKRGTPYVQIIPFKRESWKMKIEGVTEDKLKTRNFFSIKHILNNYKKLFWSKKKWK